jgi:hypothetical protein
VTAVVDEQVQPAAIDTEVLNAAQTRLVAAVGALLQPASVPLGRDASALDDEHAAAMAELRTRHAAQRRRRDRAGMRRTLSALIARERLHQAAARGRETREADVPSLLDQLHDAVWSTQGGGGAAAGVHRWHYGVDAAELLAEIRRAVAARPHDPLPLRVRSWASLAGHWRTTAPQRLLDAAVAAESWVRSARDVLNPRRRMTAVGACPDCGVAVVHQADDTGDTVRRPALEIDVSSGWARCLAHGCGATWSPERLPLLASVLEQQAGEREATQADPGD